MTIDEQIKLLESNAEFERKNGDLQGCLNFRQLANWLKDYKQLLGAIEDIKAEIHNASSFYHGSYIADGVDMALHIVGRHISGKETE